MTYLPIFLELQGRSCLVIGGGRVAFRKASALAACGARVSVVSPKVSAGVRRLIRQGKVEWLRRRFRPGDLKGMELAVAAAARGGGARRLSAPATGDRSVQEQAVREARARGVWINVVDQPEMCSFVFPSVVRRGKLVLAISTTGASPALAKWIRRDLERRYGPEYKTLLAAMTRLRPQIRRTVPGVERRKRLFAKALEAYWDALKR